VKAREVCKAGNICNVCNARSVCNVCNPLMFAMSVIAVIAALYATRMAYESARVRVCNVI